MLEPSISKKLSALIETEANYIENLINKKQIGGNVADTTRALAELITATALAEK